MGEHVKLIVGCVVFIPLIVLLLLSAWKYWHGEWLRFIAGWTFAPDEESDSPYYNRRGKRIALFNLVLAVIFTGQLSLVAVDQLGSAPTSGQAWPFAILVICFVGCGIWVLVGSWRDSKAITAGAAGTGPGLSEGYEFGARHVVVLVAVLLAAMALEIVMFLLAR